MLLMKHMRSETYLAMNHNIGNQTLLTKISPTLHHCFSWAGSLKREVFAIDFLSSRGTCGPEPPKIPQERDFPKLCETTLRKEDKHAPPSSLGLAVVR